MKRAAPEIFKMLEYIQIDERTWNAASKARRHEWTIAIREMLTPGEMIFRNDAHSLLIEQNQQGVELVAQNTNTEIVAKVTLPHDLLAEEIRQYVDIVRQIEKITEQGTMFRLEALDLAKKATHDKASRRLKRECPDFEMDHPTARRLFTLLFCLRVDTTRLVGAHGHRRIR